MTETPSEPIQFEIAPPLSEALEKLVDTGFAGASNPNDLALMLIADGVRTRASEVRQAKDDLDVL